MEPLQRTKHGFPCPICGEENMKCSFNSKVALCVNVQSDRECGGHVIMPTWIHKLSESQIPDYTPKDKKPGCVMADRETRDKVYRAFLEMLKLSPKHLGQLVRAGIRPGMILDCEYKTVPEFKDRWRYAKRLLEKGFKLDGIPGFFQAEAKGRTFWTFTAKEGMFIPVSDRDGFIIKLRIRLDKPEVRPDGKIKNKYRWFSSDGLFMGTGSGTDCHVTMGETDEIWITEGEKKADVGRDKLGKTFISVPGIYEWHKALSIIKALSPQKVVVAFDADKITNPDVIFYESKLIEALKEFPEVVVLKAEWSLSQAKGIDDLLLLGKSPVKQVA